MQPRRPILVVDDDPDVCALVRKTLEHAGYDVVTASNGMTAVRQYELNKPCMLIVDLMMPTLDGEGFLRMLGSTRPPVVLLTASTRRKELAKELGISISMSKPFDIAAIRQLANEHVPEHKRPPDAPAKPAE